MLTNPMNTIDLPKPVLGVAMLRLLIATVAFYRMYMYMYVLCVCWYVFPLPFGFHSQVNS